MKQKFGNIPEEVLGIELKEFENNYKTLAQMIAETTDEEIQEAKFAICYSGNKETPEIQTFMAWTENYILRLKFTQLGYFMMKLNRASSRVDN